MEIDSKLKFAFKKSELGKILYEILEPSNIDILEQSISTLISSDKYKLREHIIDWLDNNYIEVEDLRSIDRLVDALHMIYEEDKNEKSDFFEFLMNKK